MLIKRGNITKKTTVTDNLTKEKVHHEESCDLMPTQRSPNELYAVVKVSSSIKVTHDFQSVGVDIGLELPWPVTIDGYKEQIDKGFAAAEAIVEKQLSSKLAGLEEVVVQLSEQRSGSRRRK